MCISKNIIPSWSRNLPDDSHLLKHLPRDIIGGNRRDARKRNRDASLDGEYLIHPMKLKD